MSDIVTLSAKNQVVIPRSARQTLKLKPGRQLLVLVRDDHLIMVPKPYDFVARLRGLHKEIWEKTDSQRYPETERNAWEVSHNH